MLYADGNRLMNQTDKHNRGFEQKKTAKLGTSRNPAAITVPTEERLQEISHIFAEHDWIFNAEVDEDKEENITDLELLLNMPKTQVVEKLPGRNDPCSCGSGKKFKKCCG